MSQVFRKKPRLTKAYLLSHSALCALIVPLTYFLRKERLKEERMEENPLTKKEKNDA